MKIHPLFMFLLVAFFGCQDNVPEAKSAEVYVYATVNGKQFRYEGEEDYLAENKHWANPPFFYFGGFPSDFEGLALATDGALSGKPETLKVLWGIYSDSNFESYASGYNTDRQQPTNGKCIITKVDSYFVEGTFYFDVYDKDGEGSKKLSITNGRFRVKL